jgi:PIN domain nuclease of toxin-antitoxin system
VRLRLDTHVLLRWLAKELPHLHRDPFDRMLIVQAQLERLTILTRDRIIMQYDVPTLMAYCLQRPS